MSESRENKNSIFIYPIYQAVFFVDFVSGFFVFLYPNPHVRKILIHNPKYCFKSILFILLLLPCAICFSLSRIFSTNSGLYGFSRISNFSFNALANTFRALDSSALAGSKTITFYILILKQIYFFYFLNQPHQQNLINFLHFYQIIFG